MNRRHRVGVRVLGLSGMLAGSLVFSRPAFPASITFVQENLVSDIPGVAANTDPNLVNSWGVTFGPATPFWVNDNGTGVATLYNGSGQPFPVGNPLVVTIPPPAGGAPPSAPTGNVFNDTTGFNVGPGQPARFIFATEDGTVSGWNPNVNATNAILEVDNSGSGAVYKGLAIGGNASGPLIYAANFRAGTVDVFDSAFAQVTVPGGFADPTIPAGFAPFNIQNIDGKLYVTYALQNAEKHDDVAGLGNGFVNVFDLNGNLQQRLVSNGPLNSPWGLTLAPASFGQFAGDLLVGNFGDGKIHAFDPATGQFAGELQNPSGNAIAIDGLWALKVGNGFMGADPNKVFFSSGPDGETHGLFGSLAPVPEPGTITLFGLGLALVAGRAWHKAKRRA